MDEITKHAKILWSYLRLNQPLTPMDAICALGSDSTRVAEHAADLWNQGYGAYLIVSGGQKSRSPMNKSEGDIYADIALTRGVPKERIIIEREASNTGENISFIKEKLTREGYDFKSFILVQKPYMERRVFATFKKVWPEAQCLVTSPQIEFEVYAHDIPSRDCLIGYLIQTLCRINTYPQYGFQIPQEIPRDVEESYKALLNLGY